MSECLRVAKPGSPICVFSDWRQLPSVTDAIQVAGLIWRGPLVWDKTEAVRPCLGRFSSQCEYVVWGFIGFELIAEYAGVARDRLAAAGTGLSLEAYRAGQMALFLVHWFLLLAVVQYAGRVRLLDYAVEGSGLAVVRFPAQPRSPWPCSAPHGYRTVMTTATDLREPLVARALRLEGLTIAWNVVEAAGAVAAGVLARSIALTGFGLDSVIELVAAGMLFARLRAEAQGRELGDALERRALWVVGGTFVALALYVVAEASWTLWNHRAPESSPAGLALTALALVVMPLLARAKLRVGRQLGSSALVADAKESFACAWLAAAALLGLALNAAAGLWWADPVAALAMVPLLVREGREAFEEARGSEGCADCHDTD